MLDERDRGRRVRVDWHADQESTVGRDVVPPTKRVVEAAIDERRTEQRHGTAGLRRVALECQRHRDEQRAAKRVEEDAIGDVNGLAGETPRVGVQPLREDSPRAPPEYPCGVRKSAAGLPLVRAEDDAEIGIDQPRDGAVERGRNHGHGLQAGPRRRCRHGPQWSASSSRGDVQRVDGVAEVEGSLKPANIMVRTDGTVNHLGVRLRAVRAAYGPTRFRRRDRDRRAGRRCAS